VNKSYHEHRTAHRDIVTSLLFKGMKQRLIDVTQFRISKSLLDPLRSKALKILVLFSQIFWSQNLRDQIPEARQLHFFYFLFLVSL